MSYIPDSKFRAQVKPHRDAVLSLLRYHLGVEAKAIGDNEIQLSCTFSDYSYKSVSLAVDMYGDWQFVEEQDECNDNYHYTTDLNLMYDCPANEVVNTLINEIL